MAVKTGTVIVGGGQAGLSLSAYLTSRNHPHVVLERGRVGERWRSERWDSLHMLTPNSLNQLDGAPGHADPDGFLTRDAFVDYLEQYASSAGMPVREHVDVLSVERHRGRFRVHTDDGEWVAKQVVVATGDCGVPYRPPAASTAPPELAQLDAAQYRRPEQLAAGSVLVVGAGPSGLQIAAELRRSGRDVVLAVGRHARGVRRYRGRDIFHWLQRLGDPEQSVDDVPAAARRTPGFGLSGQNGGEQLDLATVSELGVTLAGRLTGFDRLSASFDDNLRRDRRACRPSVVQAPRENRRPHRRVVGCSADFACRAGRRRAGWRRAAVARSTSDRRVDDHLGDRVQARVSVAAHARLRCGRRDRSPPRRHAGSRAVRARTQIPEQAHVAHDRRGRARRTGDRRSDPAGASGSAEACLARSSESLVARLAA